MNNDRSISGWVNRYFFVREKKPRIIISLGSVGVGLAVDIMLDVFRRTDKEFFLNHYSRPTERFMRYIVTLGVSMRIPMVVGHRF